MVNIFKKNILITAYSLDNVLFLLPLKPKMENHEKTNRFNSAYFGVECLPTR